MEMLVWADTARMSSWMVLKKRAWSFGVVYQDLIEPQADDGGLIVDAIEVLGAGEPPPAPVAHFGCVEGSMGLSAAAGSVCQFGSPLNVSADVYGPGCKCTWARGGIIR